MFQVKYLIELKSKTQDGQKNKKTIVERFRRAKRHY